jgi:thiamine phosphate synthase YjbQ (UPF0047 family)
VLSTPFITTLLATRAASVHVNDDEAGLFSDYEDWLEELVLHEPVNQYRHSRTGEDGCPERSDRNADAYLKHQITGREVVVAVTYGRLDFGTWERIFQGQAEWPIRES